MRQQVMAAKVAWKARYSSSGRTTPLLKVAAVDMVLAASYVNMPFMKTRSNPPKNALPSVKARL